VSCCEYGFKRVGLHYIDLQNMSAANKSFVPLASAKIVKTELGVTNFG